MSEVPKNTNPDPVGNFKGFLFSVWDFFVDLIDLKEGMDRKGTIQNIKDNKRMKGANAWMLMCSIMIASLGLDLNSPAVIIGAMLISPLMSPILGVGLGIGINDRETLYVSIQHFGISIGIALFTSTFYFYFTPFGDATNEIISRTSPNTLDALVAFFGGIAGIISGSRIDKSNAIPGVAIATALMPPLCVTGFGIANGAWEFMFNSFYLFFLNATLVALATFLIVRFLRFPMKQYESEKEKRKMHMMIYIFSILVTLPSIYILNNVWKDYNYNRHAKEFLINYCKDDFTYIDSWEIAKRDSFNLIGIKVYNSNKGNVKESDMFNEKKMQAALRATDPIFDNTIINIIPTSEVDLNNIKKLETKLSDFEKIADQLEVAKESQSNDQLRIIELQNRLDSIRADTLPFQQFSGELKAAFPIIHKVAFAEAKESDFNNTGEIPILILDWNKGTSLATQRKEKARIMDFVQVRLGLDTLKMVQY